ncbi:MAG: phage tail sheath C-terminal domain-containing protein [Clostridiaceae bacterium]
MGLPEILINFITKANNAIQRSSRGIVVLILNDDTDKSFDTKIYKGIDEVDEADFTSDNYDYISKAFLGKPSKVIVERIDVDATDYGAVLARLKSKRFNYLAIPGIEETDVSSIASWIKARRSTDKKTFKAVLPNSVSDDEGIINFATDEIKVGGIIYTTAEYCVRIAGILAGLSLTRSATYFVLSEVESIKESTDANADIDAGKLILINDGEKIKIARAINSFTTTTEAKGEDYKKIKIIEGMDLMKDDIRDTFQNDYVGQKIDDYDNKISFLAAVNQYFKQLGKESILDKSADNIAEIDVQAHINYIEAKGIDIDTLNEQQIKEYNTGSKVFITAQAKLVDAMEDLYFDIYI